MLITLKSPGAYIQDQNIIKDLYPHLHPFGEKALFLISPSGMKRHKKDILDGFEGKDFSCFFEVSAGECSQEEIDRIVQLCRSQKTDMLVGVGGGKILDITKAAADAYSASCVIIPTVASTDAPCSALSVLYTPDGIFDRYLHVRRSPDLVLVDTQIIANAPARFLSYGMGDALATYFEARAVQRSFSVNQIGTYPTGAAFALATCCRDTLYQYGKEAYLSAQKNEVSPALEKIVEANTYLSGVGFESGGVAAAHALQKGVTVIPALHAIPHGKIVAFNTIVQLCLEKAPKEEVDSVLSFCQSIDLPTCFADLTQESISKEDWLEAARFTCCPGMTVHKMPFAVTPQMLLDAIYEADAAGRAFCKASV